MKLFKPYIFCCFLFLSGPLSAQHDPLPVADLTVSLPIINPSGKSKAGNEASYFYGFQQGDIVLLDLKAEGKATFDLEVKEFGSGSVIYSAKSLAKIKRMQLPVRKKTVYEFIFRTNSPENASGKFTVKRIPANPEAKAFNPNVSWQIKTDTIYHTVTEKVPVKTELQPQVLVDKTFRVFSQTSIGNPSRVTVPFKIPPRTKHWVYWLGVGQESVKQLEETTKMVAKGGGVLIAAVNPVAAFGMGLLPYLPQVKSSGYVDYLFMNSAAIKAFEEDGVRKPLPIAQGRAVVSDYSKVLFSQTPKTPDGTLYMGIENKNTVTGLDVVLKIVAFQEETHYESRRVKKVHKINQARVPVFGE